MGFVAALAGLALGVSVGTLTLPDGREALASGYWLALMLAISGVPLAVGYGIIAFVHALVDAKPGDPRTVSPGHCFAFRGGSSDTRGVTPPLLEGWDAHRATGGRSQPGVAL